MSSLQPHLVALAGRVAIALAAGAGTKYRSLIVLGCIVAQDRARVQYHLAMALYYVKLNHLITAALALVTLVVVIFVFKSESKQKQRRPEPKAETEPWTGPGKPLFFPCVISHARFVPKRHAFVYSYLVVGVPVGWTGVCGGMISVAGCGPTEERNKMKKGWYHIDAEDYLERGNGNLGLRGKLDAHLVSNDVDPKQYPHAYFVTAAKFLGYHFNPISFWYLYNADKQLKAVVLEVNNTFGERRMYYLPLKSEEVACLNHKEETCACRKEGASFHFKQSWPKDFHVSPFNSRKGSYELVANDPLAPNMQGTGPITVKVVLRTSENESKLVARLSTKTFGKRTETGATSTSSSLDPATMNLWQKTNFLAAWWWVGFATFPRIVKHAGILFFWKRLHVWFRPEPLLKSMGRLSDSTEKKLEESFRLYLRHLVDNVEDKKDDNGSNKPLAIMYYPCGTLDVQPCLFTSPSADKDAILDALSAKKPYNEADVIQIYVLTPVFYTRFVGYAHDVEAFFCEHLESFTIEIKPPGAAAILSKRVLTKPTVQPPVDTGLIDFMSFNIIRKLRRRPEPIKRPMIWPAGKSSSAAPDVSNDSKSPEAASIKVSKDLRYFRLSAMDGFFLSLGREYKHVHKSYRSTLLSLFLADRFLSGSLELLSVVKFSFYLSIAWLCTPILLWVLSTGGLY